MSASLSDILTTQKNGVIAINNLKSSLECICTSVQALVGAIPSTVSPTLAASTTTQVAVGSGRLFAVSITVHSGSSQVYVYDSATVGGISASNCIYCSLPANAATFQSYQTVSLVYTQGLVLKTDASMNFCVAYTPN
jgi:hypothetical protein